MPLGVVASSYKAASGPAVRGYVIQQSTNGSGGPTLSTPQSSFSPSVPVSGDWQLGFALLNSADSGTSPSVAAPGSSSAGPINTNSGSTAHFNPSVSAGISAGLTFRGQSGGSADGSFTLNWGGDLATFTVMYIDFSGLTGITNSNNSSYAAGFGSPSLTPAVSTDVLICIVAVNGLTTFAVPSGMTLIGQHKGADYSSAGVSLAAAYKVLGASGATGTQTWSYNQLGGESVGSTQAVSASFLATTV